MISVAEAYARVLATAPALPPETLPLPEATGRILAEDLAADRDFPPFDRVAMDGIAVAHAAWAGGQTVFPVAHAQFAGAPARPLPGPGVAVEVMTGAVLPPGADAVVRYEDITLTNQQATINIAPPAQPGTNVHTQATDRRRGDLLLPAGTRLTPAALAVAATVGAPKVRVTRLARVAVVSTGDELVDVAATPLPHQIRRSNAYAVQALLAPAGADVHLFHLPDDLPRLRQGLTNILAAGFDAVVLSGAVSKGRADHLPTLLRELGVVEIFHEVNQRPGKPMWFGARADGGPVVFGLPGNPVSTLLTAARYVRPWLLATQQPAAGAPGPTPAVLTAPVQFRPALAHLLPVAIAVDALGVRRATPIAVGGSGDLAGLLGADAFLELPAELTDFAPGTVWPAWPLS
ncbi:molybdopterin molybdotransferase MoeA [Hymenobacter nivis]|uniref:Molybdopterin molybdenumtransferase n=1 Tax=Hymenobacter nivis TaxID=1850093 RepID=A0A2Z3GY46_9BACT|nr:molybdopterin molybdotransferase MoeA [Hymenobacter nivis]AWM34314.1 molybdopterin molybdenumtransferase MoeA [Hymenobacter nivis]